MQKLKELQANNPDVDYVFISMDKAEDKWRTGMENMRYPEITILTIKWCICTSHRFRLDSRYIILDKTGKIVLYRAIETDFDTINSTLADLK
jgi:hypothetical protein